MTDILQAFAGALVPIVGFMVRHYGRKAQAREKAAEQRERSMQESINVLMQQNEKLCSTVRSAYKRIRKEQHALRTQFQQHGNG